MAELRIETPGQPSRRIPLLARPVVVGRHESCDVQILEVKASKRHLEIVPGPIASGRGADGAPTWIVTDLGSSNGTLVGEARILRKEIAIGDVVRVGDTTIVVATDASSPEPAVAAPVAAPRGLTLSKGLVLDTPSAPAATAAAVPVAATPIAAIPVAGTSVAGASSSEASDGAARSDDADDDVRAEPTGPTPDERRAAARGRKAIARGAIVLAAGLAALVGVEVLFGSTADKRVRDREEAAAYLDLLARRDEPYAAVLARFEEFRRAWPASARTPELEKLVDSKRAEEARTGGDEAELARLVGKAATGVDAATLGGLSDLLERHGSEGDPLRRRIVEALAAARGKALAAFEADRAATRTEVERLLAARDAGAALRRARAFLAAWPGMTPAQRAEATDDSAAVAKAAAGIADAALAEAERAADPDARRRILLAAIRGLDGTAELDRVASVLRRVSGGSVSSGVVATGPAGGVATGPGTAPPPSSTGASSGLLSSDVLARIAEAEAAARARRWGDAAAAYDRLLALDTSARIRTEWAERRADLARVIGLVEELGRAVAAAPSGVLGVPVGGATWEVSKADVSGVTAKRSGKVETIPWPDVPPRDLLELLAHGASTPDRRLAIAALAADLGDRPAAVEQLIPLLDVPTHRDLAIAMMAHRVEGRTSIPEGGYRALEGDLLDVVEWTKRTNARRIVELRAEADAIRGKAAADPLFEKLKAVRAKREELDRRRAYALLAIFNTKHWPYPHDAPSMQTPYAVVTQECERRWKLVEEVWNDPASTKSVASAALEKLVARHAEIVAELRTKDVDVDGLEQEMEPFAIYVGAGPMTVKTYFRSKEEKELLAYNRWVVETWNPAHPGGAAPNELQQISVTNEYRMMMGFAFEVEPGPASLDAIDGANVATLLDQGKETSRRPLRAVRIDERLVRAARAHSDDMVKRGFFAHFAPANPATGEAGTDPMQRMSRHGYEGSGSENIAMSSSPEGAHQMWLHSSGHHRNILSPWDDMGMGFSGARATQNFGSGVSETVIVEDGSATPPGKKPRRKDR